VSQSIIQINAVIEVRSRFDFAVPSGSSPIRQAHVLDIRRGLALPLLLVLAFFATLQSRASSLALVGAKIYLSPSNLPSKTGQSLSTATVLHRLDRLQR
jgi:hypothetical protein